MSDREQDVAIAKAMNVTVIDWWYHADCECGGLEPVMDENDEGRPYLALLDEHGDSGKWYRETAILEPSFAIPHTRDDGSVYRNYEPIPDYGSPQGSWLILDYVRENPDSKFAERFLTEIEKPFYPNCLIWQVLPNLTPSIIKEAAFEAAKGLIHCS